MTLGVRENPGTTKALLKLLLFTLLVPGSVTVWVPYFFLSLGTKMRSFEIDSFTLAGILSIALGTIGYLWCAWDFTFTGRGTPAPIDPPKILVARGLYSIIRNPMYVSVMLVLLGESLLFESRNLFVYAAWVWVVFHLWVLLYEEPTLRKKFGESYEEYCKAVPRWIPRLAHRTR